MRVLFANNQLDERAGSELYTLELSTALKARGHTTAIFTFHPGEVAQLAREAGVTVFLPHQREEMREFRADVLHIHHAPTLYFLAGSARVEAPVVYSVLGALPALEGPPLVWRGVNSLLTVSEEVAESLSGSPFGKAFTPRVFRNWFDDRDLRPQQVRAPREVRRIAVVTNHLAPELSASLHALAAQRPTFSWTHFGAPNRAVPITPELLDGFDGVVTIGRTALLAGAVGKPCLLLDVHGSDGVLSAENLARVATRNFSGRLHGHRPGTEELAEILFEQFPRASVQETAEALWAQFRLSGRVETLEEIHQAATKSGARLTRKMAADYGKAGDAHAELIVQMAGARIERDRLRHERDEAHNVVAAQGEELALARRALHEAQARLAEQARDLHRIRNTLVGRAVSRIFDEKDRLVPAGSRRRSAYERVLQPIRERWLKR